MTEQQIKAHLNCWRKFSAVKTALALRSRAAERSCPTHHLGDPGHPGGGRTGTKSTSQASIYSFSPDPLEESYALLHLSLRHAKCKIFYPKRKVQRTLAAVMSFPYDSKPLGSSLGQPEFTFKSILFPVLL